ncbi:MAG: enoyl-CoA hydratase/isomerase family protein [Rhodospirillales bacterium]
MDREILFERRGVIGLATLNRPEALNALTLDMVRAYARQLAEWEKDPAVRAVVLRGAGGRAFCAGGDVVAVHDAGKAGDRMTRDFFREEYTLNYRISRLAVPHVALIDGVTMGGGVGLSVHGSHRVATERTLFAMPETGIGLFPDVGGGYFLPRLPGEIGMYLAMTGQRLRLADCMYARIATHAVAVAGIDKVVEALAGADYGRDGRAAVDRLLAGFAADPGQPPLAAHRAAIDRCFAGDTVEGMLAALEREATDWARQQRAAMLTKSPTSMKISARQLRRGARMDFADELRMEYRLSQGCMAGHDYYEGVRALLVDKDNKPRWKPPTLAEVDEDVMARHFDAVPADGDLVLK